MVDRQWVRSWGVAGALAAVVTSCGGEEPRSLGQAPDGGVEAERAPPAAGSTLSRAAFIEARQAEGARDVEQHFQRLAAGGLTSLAQGLALRVTLQPAAVELAPGLGEAWGASLSLESYGCEGELTPVPRAEVEARVGAAPNRAQYERLTPAGALSEWYVSGPLGLEQGFTLTRSPCRSDRAQVAVLELGVDGLTPVAAPVDAQRIELQDAEGVARLHYSDLWATDARGVVLPARMSVDDTRIVLRIETEGARFPVTVDPLVWAQAGKLTASDGAASEGFGKAVSVEGDTAVVGAYFASVQGKAAQGAVYVYGWSGVAWVQQHKLTASDGAAGDNFGSAVRLSGSTLLVGAPSADAPGVADSGAAYVFVRSAGSWTEQAKLVSASPATGEKFGFSVDLDGDTALVGAPTGNVAGRGPQGYAALLRRSGGAWSSLSRLEASEGTSGDQVGYAVALSGTHALVGAPYSLVQSSSAAGAVYAFEEAGGWGAVAPRLVASTPVTAGHFGQALRLAGARALVGSPGETAQGTPNAGVVHVYQWLTPPQWSLQATLSASDRAAGAEFGAAVDLSGTTALIGAWWTKVNANTRQGAAYLFGESGGSWSQLSRWTAADGAANDRYGVGVGVAGKHALVGAHWADVAGKADQGAAYAYHFGSALGDACATGADCASGYCSDGVCCNEACSGACDACAVATGAPTSGTCVVLARGSLGTPPCSPKICDGVSRGCQACVADAECPAGRYCAAGGTCEPRKGQGEACRTGAGQDCSQAGCRVCSSGHCVDGVCCDSACSGACGSCLGSSTGQPNGTCAPIAAGTDPDKECPDPAPESCGPDGTCGGGFACRPYAQQGTVCGANTCSGGQSSGQQCDGAGNCKAVNARDCAPYLCGVSACTTSCTQSAECHPDAFCNAFQKCEFKRDVGEVCAAAKECVSGKCADGVCCNDACSGQCEACNLAGSEGTCLPVTGAPPPGRAPCAGAGACAGACNGGNRTACVFPGQGTTCGPAACEGDSSRASSTCDGAGVCQDATPQGCAPYGCDPGAGSCRTSCATTADCAAGNVCDVTQHRCVLSTTTCKDATTVRNPDGSEASCLPYRCTAGVCRDACSAPLDCADGYVCEQSRCVLDGAAGSGGGAGTAGTGGSAGVAGTGGTSGTGGSAGVAGTGGSAGVAGTGGSAGVAGASGSAGVAGASGAGGGAGTAGQGGGGPGGGAAQAGEGGGGGLAGEGGTSGTGGSAGTSGRGGSAGGSSGTAGSGATAGGAGQAQRASSGDDGGCGCRVPSARSRGSAVAWLAAAALAGVARRRRRAPPVS